VLASTPTGDRILSAREFEDLAAVSGPGQVRLLKTICDEGNLLALSAAEAFDYGLSDGIVTQRDELLEALKLSGTPVVEVHASWSELFVNQLGGLVRYVLFGLGALLLLLELKSPGFGLLGIAGLLLVGTVFFRNYLAGLADMPELLLILLGLVLLALELFVIPASESPASSASRRSCSARSFRSCRSCSRKRRPNRITCATSWPASAE
jgi:membrane-bound serine protease (ClpP class)